MHGKRARRSEELLLLDLARGPDLGRGRLVGSAYSLCSLVAFICTITTVPPFACMPSRSCMWNERVLHRRRNRQRRPFVSPRLSRTSYPWHRFSQYRTISPTPLSPTNASSPCLSELDPVLLQSSSRLCLLKYHQLLTRWTLSKVYLGKRKRWPRSSQPLKRMTDTRGMCRLVQVSRNSMEG